VRWCGGQALPFGQSNTREWCIDQPQNGHTMHRPHSHPAAARRCNGAPAPGESVCCHQRLPSASTVRAVIGVHRTMPRTNASKACPSHIRDASNFAQALRAVDAMSGSICACARVQMISSAVWPAKTSGDPVLHVSFINARGSARRPQYWTRMTARHLQTLAVAVDAFRMTEKKGQI